MILNKIYEYAVKICHQLHMYPQIGVDLERSWQMAESIDFE